MSDNARQNLKQLFGYIRAMTERRFTTMYSYKDYSFNLELNALPIHETISTPSFLDPEDTTQTETILRIEKANVPECPAPPFCLSGWLLKGWNDPTEKLAFAAKRYKPTGGNLLVFENPEDPHNRWEIDPENIPAEKSAPIEAVGSSEESTSGGISEDAPKAKKRTSKKTSEAAEEREIELFDSDATRVAQFEKWAAVRAEWAETAKEAGKARKLYDALYSLYSVLERERDRLELMVGDGILETTLDDGTKISHPLILERVVLVFDSSVPCFSIHDSDSNPIVYTRLLRGIDKLESACLSEYSALIERELIHPFEGKRFDDLLTSFANSLSSDCEFIGKDGSSKAPFRIRRGAVLFTRQRASGYGAILDKIIEDIDAGGELAPSLLSIIGANDTPTDDESPENDTGTSGALEVNGLDSRVLLEKEANREQLIIARKLASCPAVLVQGPPGTGKTHTISNIIGDLLAQGKSVLVTSHTSKALSVLRDKISEPVRPLCVSVLDDNKRQLEQSLTAINDYMSSNNVESLDAEGNRLEQERTALIERLAALRGQLLTLVSEQYTPIDAGNDVSYTPKDAALYIASLDSTSFISDVVSLDTGLPLSAEEIAKLYESNAALPAEEEALLLSGAPDCSALLQPAVMRRLCGILASDGDTEGNPLWDEKIERPVEALESLRDKLAEQTRHIGSAEPWMLSLARIGASGQGQNEVFATIANAIPQLRTEADSLRLTLLDTKPMIPDELVNVNTGSLLAEIYNSLDSEKINWLTVALRPKWKQLLDRCVINGEKPDTRSEVGILCKYHTLLINRQKLTRRWNDAVASLGGPALSSETPEEQAAMAWDTVAGWLGWFEGTWKPIRDYMVSLGFRYDQFMETLPLSVRMEGDTAAAFSALSGELPVLVEAEYFKGNRADCADTLAKASHELLAYAEQFPVIAALRDAVEQQDPEAYSAAFNDYDIICGKRALCDERQALLSRLAQICPKWSTEIRNREGVNGGSVPPDDLDKHWLRARLRGELARRCAVPVADIQTAIDTETSKLSALTRDLISARAWSAQLRTMRDQSKKRSLAEWVELVKRVGKGTGKRAEQLRSSGELRRAMKNCRRAVPVWIMPLSDVAEYFEPSDEKFDVLIIDEASQADITSLISLYLARKVIVVGDDKQVSPTPIGLDIDASAKLRQEFLSDIPAASMYDEMVSIYDIAKANYEPITLREHFRCADDIINYSNYYTYNGIICPLRDSRSIKLHPSTVAYRVPDGSTGGKKTNKREAVNVAALIAACNELPEYKNATFGVITMTGDEQAVLIDRLLREKLTENCYQERNILCGNPSYFQGDERDVIFISLVDSGNESGRALATRREGYNEMYAKRFNVAASRARDQMWVVHSLDPAVDLKADDIRLGLIRHAEHPEETAAALAKDETPVLSAMELDITNTLEGAGYTVTARQRVGSYIVGLTCEGEGGRVAIECDGDRTLEPDSIAAEINKQSVLERLGWRFIRLRASEYYTDPSAFLETIVEQVQSKGLSPAQASEGAVESTLLDRVLARAQELLNEWDNENDAESDSADIEVPTVEEQLEAAAANAIGAPADEQAVSSESGSPAEEDIPEASVSEEKPAVSETEIAEEASDDTVN